MNAPGEPALRRIGGRYLLEERIGAGAMGAVWRGTDERLNRPVAIKELLVALAGGTDHSGTLEDARQRLEREARLAARLQHPHVISMFDVVLDDNRPWLVMEYLPSKSLATVLVERGTLPPEEVAEVGRQVADGLAAAHAAGVVHRDVKPGNVLLGDDGRVKLTDFGVSRAVDDVQITRTGLIAGTPAFLAPESARGREPSAASDVFALGATLYTAVEGRPPFGLDDNAYALLHKVATGYIDPPQRAGPLTTVLGWLLAAEPSARPSAAQARDALAAVAMGVTPVRGPTPDATAVIERGPFDRRSGPPARLAGPPPTSQPVRAAPRRLRPPARPTRRVVPLWLILVVVLLLGAVVTTALVTSSGGDLPSAAQPAPVTPPPRSGGAVPPPTGSGVANPIAVVQSYYALLPGDTDSAFAMLSAQAQQDSGGRAAFERFWATVDGVAVGDARVVGENIVQATILFDNKNRPDTREQYRLVLSRNDEGQPLITNFTRLGS